MTLKKYRNKYVILWPQYFDSSLTRQRGRKVPKELSVPKPTQKELLEAARSLGFDALPLEGRYPREWWNREGPVLVEKHGSKRRTMLLIAQELRKKRYEES